MRKGAWLNRPIIVNSTPPTNEYDVQVAKAKALPAAIDSIGAYNGTTARIDYYSIIERLTKAMT